VNVDVCTGCGACAKACKYDAVKMRDGLPLVCDLCNGSPICVTRCPTKALSFVEGAIEPEDAEEEHRKLMVRWGMIA
jgi:Fe-S-cluster-containing hydrogenase component 2